MATPTPKRDLFARYPPRPPAGAPEVAPLEMIDPRWLLKALGISLAVAALLGYLAVCLLVYQGGWQLMLHPSPRVDRTPANAATPFQAIRFDAAATGHTRLTAWWIPASSPTANTPTLLFLHDGQGSLASNVDQLALLHRTSANLFAIDYRGFGDSDGPHPSEARMSEDTAAALDYLINTRHIAPASIFPYGAGLGAALAASLAQTHPELPGVVLDNPDSEAGQRPANETRARLIPVRLLLRDRFDLVTPLRALKQPKLLLIGGPSALPAAVSRERNASNAVFFRTIPDPKISVELPSTDADSFFLEAVQRFLDQSHSTTSSAR